MLDLVIEKGRLVDGSGNPWFFRDVGVKDGRIAEIGDLGSAQARDRIDATGKVVCPGFTDMHTHSDLMLLRYPEAEIKLRQGVTLEVVGVDGLSVAPIDDANRATWRARLRGLLGEPGVEWTWNSLGEHLSALEKAQPAVNVASLVGHGTIRCTIMGLDDRPPSADEMRAMKAMTCASMEEGAFGLSTALNVAPGEYASTAELADLAGDAGRYGGFYMSHMRSESDGLLESFEELVQIGRQAKCPAHVSHHKSAGPRNWGKVSETLGRIDRLREHGFDITSDRHPYMSGAFALDTLLPRWIHDGGIENCISSLGEKDVRARLKKEMQETRPDRENMAMWSDWGSCFLTSAGSEANKDIVGKSFREIGELRGVDPYDAIFDILVEERLDASTMTFFGREADMLKVLGHPTTMVGSDGVFAMKPHPRLYGTFPRILGRCVREMGVFRLEDAIRKMTSLPAERLGLRDRGLIREGMWADVTVFDPWEVADRATYEDPKQFPKGIDAVIVNGVVSLRDGELTGQRAGAVLRRGS